MLCGKAKFLQQIHSRAGVAVHIVDTDARDRRRAMLGKCGGDRFAETADDVVLFNRDTAVFLPEAITNSSSSAVLMVWTMMTVTDAFFFQCIGSLNGFLYRDRSQQR